MPHTSRLGKAAFLGAGVAVLLASFQPVAAQDEMPEDTYVDALRACQKEADPEARLACFDSAASAIVSGSDKGDLRIVDSKEVRETRRKLFGFTLPDFGIFGHRPKDGDEKAEKIDSLTTTIAKVHSTGPDGYVITTADGAVWRIDNPPRRMMTPKVGQSLEIRNAALTSFFLRIDGRSGVKGYRVR